MVTPSNAIPPTILVDGLVRRPSSYDESRLRELASEGDGETLLVAVDVLLGEVVVRSKVSHVSVISDDGEYTASIPVEVVRSGGQIHLGAVSSLPLSAGGPFRLVVEGGKTLCWNVKNVGELRCTSQAEPDSVPENPPH